MTTLNCARRGIAVALLAGLACSPAYALFANTCLLFNISTRSHPLPEGWLGDSLFELSTKKLTPNELNSLHYSSGEETSEAPEIISSEKNTTYYMVDGKIRFVLPEQTSATSGK